MLEQEGGEKKRIMNHSSETTILNSDLNDDNSITTTTPNEPQWSYWKDLLIKLNFFPSFLDPARKGFDPSDYETVVEYIDNFLIAHHYSHKSRLIHSAIQVEFISFWRELMAQCEADWKYELQFKSPTYTSTSTTTASPNTHSISTNTHIAVPSIDLIPNLPVVAAAVRENGPSCSKLNCPAKDLDGPQVQDLVLHIQRQHPETTKNCYWENCNLIAESHQALVDHVNAFHCVPNNDQYECKWKDCPVKNTFDKRVQFSIHLREHTGDLPFACRDCMLKFRSIPCLKEHQQQDHLPMPCVDLDGCTAILKGQRAFNLHRKEHEIAAAKKARLAQKALLIVSEELRISEERRRLARELTRDKIDALSLTLCHWEGCTHECTTFENLRIHLEVHFKKSFPTLDGDIVAVGNGGGGGELQALACKWDGCKFSGASLNFLTRHAIKEHAVDSFRCPYYFTCPEVFKQANSEFSQHVCQHAKGKEPPIACKYCLEGFTSNRKLNEHWELNHAEVDRILAEQKREDGLANNKRPRQNDSEDIGEEEEADIEKIVEKRRKGGVTEYLVQRKGKDADANNEFDWFEELALMDEGHQDLFQDFQDSEFGGQYMIS